MEYLQAILDSTRLPVLSAFILGIMTAISPCPLATNITAAAYISKEIESRRKVFISGLVYTAGRAFSYTALGMILLLGASKFHVSRFLQTNGEKYIGILLLIIGVLMLDFINLGRFSLNNLTDRLTRKLNLGTLSGSFLLGVLFALAFCPYSGVLYFGMLIPLALTSQAGVLLPPVFAIATGLPVVVIAWIIAFSLSSVGNFYNRLNVFEKWLRRIVAGVFIIGGIYFILIYFFKLSV
ncbi:MAG TPA: aromatic aminobenezylarsenical efflux permease ArsG family transporter [Bacteroidales bacterium]|nr:aromatic aminobenezylarsenical efflux permease ArsG family transporter [Bacteroidales bacterium]